MKTQISRDPYQPDKRYSGVYQQQGRMLTDADWNALAEIVKRRLDEALADVIGSGAPRDLGFNVIQGSSGPQFTGRQLYAGGVPAEVVPERLGELFGYGNQADFPAPPSLPESTEYVLYADVWERSVDSLEDTGDWTTDHLRDPALHGADTTTRTQTMAQVKWCPPAASFPLPEDGEANPRIGDSLLTVELRAGQAGSDDCDPCAEEVAVSRRVGNYLFRLEVHDVEGGGFGASPTGVTLKWSSENGAEQHRVGTEPADFKTGGYVYEFYNGTTEKHLGVHLAAGFTPARGELHAAWPTTPPAGFDRVRRWDGYAVLGRDGIDWSLGESGGDVQLGDGEGVVLDLPSLAVTLDPRTFVAGDYWLAPVRESVHAAGTAVLTQAPPHGILHRYVRLAKIGADGAVETPGTDLAQSLSFSPLTDLKARDVDYATACPAGFFNPPEDFDTVQKALDRLCTLAADDVAFAKPCDTSLYSGVPQESIKTVADALGLLCDIEARHVEYVPEGDCTLLAGLATVQQALDRLCKITAADVPYAAHPGCAALNPGIATVKDALDTLCGRPSGGGGCHTTVGIGGEFATLNEAIERALADGKTTLCFCLLPGDHILEPLVIDVPRQIDLTLSGCGWGSRLVFPQEMVRLNNIRSLRIEHLFAQIDQAAQLVTGGCFRVDLEGVLAVGIRPPDAPPALSFSGTSSLRLAASELFFLGVGTTLPIAELFAPVSPDLGSLFEKTLEDKEFEARNTEVAEKLAGLSKAARSRISDSITEEALRRFEQPLQLRLKSFGDLVGAAARPDPAKLAQSLAEIRRVIIILFPAPAMSLESVIGDATLVDNRILGVVSVYGPLSPLSAPLSQLELSKLREAFQPQSGSAPIQIVPAAERLCISRNEISRLDLGAPVTERLRELSTMPQPAGTVVGVYRSVSLAQNRLTSGLNRVLGKDVRWTDNFFELFSSDLGATLADTANYSGNAAVEDDGWLFFNLARRFNAQTLRDLNTMIII